MLIPVPTNTTFHVTMRDFGFRVFVTMKRREVSICRVPFFMCFGDGNDIYVEKVELAKQKLLLRFWRSLGAI